MSMVDWTQVPKDLMMFILCKLSVVDHCQLTLVCKPWWSLVVEYMNAYRCAHPCLMVPGTDILRDTNCKSRRILVSPALLAKNNENHIPKIGVPHADLCRGSYQGWLVMINNDMDMYLLNPFSRNRIDLPSVMTLQRLSPPRPGYRGMCKWRIHKAFLSTTPTNSNGCFVMVIQEGDQRVAFCKVGDTNWRSIYGPDGKPYSAHSFGSVDDAIFFKGKFYVIACTRVIYVCDPAALEPTMTEYYSGPNTCPDPARLQMYLVESRGEELLIVFRISTSLDDQQQCLEVHLRAAADISDVKCLNIPSKHSRYEEVIDTFDYDDNFGTPIHYRTQRTLYFEVYKLDTRSTSEPTWIQVNTLDGESLFVGLNQSFSNSNPLLSGYKENQIYFTDDAIHLHRRFCCSGNDIGVFDLKEGTIESLYKSSFKSTRPPPIWVIPKP